MAVRPNFGDLNMGFSIPSDGPAFPPLNFIDTNENEGMPVDLYEETISDSFSVSSNHPMQLRSDHQRVQSSLFEASPQYISYEMSETRQTRIDILPEAPPGVRLPGHFVPLDPEDQEKVKLDRKRERNRIAAAKCRRKKLERIEYEEKRIKHYRIEIGALQASVKQLENELRQVKLEAWKHIDARCNIPITKEGLSLRYPVMDLNQPQL